MLDEMLDCSLGMFADQRDKYMQEIVELTGSILQKHIDRCKADAGGFQTWIEDCEKSKCSQEAVVKDLESEIVSHQANVWGKVQELAAAAKTYQTHRDIVQR